MTSMEADAVTVLPELVTALAVKVYVPASEVSSTHFPSETLTLSPFRVYSTVFILSARVVFTVKYASSPV